MSFDLRPGQWTRLPWILYSMESLCGPIQCFQHAVDTKCVLISVKNKAGTGCTSLHCLISADVLLSVRIPEGRGALQHQTDNVFVGPLLDTRVADLQVPSEESEHLVGFIADIIYMLVPVELSVDGDPEIFG